MTMDCHPMKPSPMAPLPPAGPSAPRRRLLHRALHGLGAALSPTLSPALSPTLSATLPLAVTAPRVSAEPVAGVDYEMPVPAWTLDRQQAAWAAQSMDQAWAALDGMPPRSPLIDLELPDQAVDGALVPVRVSSALPGSREILLLVDGNPQTLAAQCRVDRLARAQVALRIRLARSGWVHAVVLSQGRWYGTAREVQVSASGCA